MLLPRTRHFRTQSGTPAQARSRETWRVSPPNPPGAECSFLETSQHHPQSTKRARWAVVTLWSSLVQNTTHHRAPMTPGGVLKVHRCRRSTLVEVASLAVSGATGTKFKVLLSQNNKNDDKTRIKRHVS